MQFIPLLGKKLKDDEVIEILESLDIEVIYDFDRLHEGQPDKYWAGAKKDGFLFRFDEAQTLDVVFLYIMPSDVYAAISQHGCDIPFFTTSVEAQTSGDARHSQVTKGSADFLGVTNVQQLVSQQTTATGGSASDLDKDAAKLTKTLGDLSVGLQSLQLVNGGEQYALTMTLANVSKSKSIWVAMNRATLGDRTPQAISDPNGNEFESTDRDVNGVATSMHPDNTFNDATEIKPGDSTEVTIKFFSPQRRKATAGQCKVQLEFLIGNDFYNHHGQCVLKTFMARMDAQ
ncbi:MAG TPA: hypothetical protein VK815_08930 [Candidatus Acidoferrales bacterium]|jgi:hypothetical protein|nr:hypothetical protein [Candidatus Acidoferrales bacterium]